GHRWASTAGPAAAAEAAGCRRSAAGAAEAGRARYSTAATGPCTGVGTALVGDRGAEVLAQQRRRTGDQVSRDVAVERAGVGFGLQLDRGDAGGLVGKLVQAQARGDDRRRRDERAQRRRRADRVDDLAADGFKLAAGAAKDDGVLRLLHLVEHALQ